MEVSTTGTPATLDRLLGEASWLLSHAEALSIDGQRPEAEAELARAARCEEEAASLLDAAGREAEAATHRVSAASCYEQLGQYAQAVTLLRAALSVATTEPYRQTVTQLLARCLAVVERGLTAA
jgi:tetratricopeptide (TPR) repeat protein